MKTRYLIATILILFGFIVHSIGGELMDIKSLMASDIPLNLKIELWAVWYLVAIDFLISGILMFYILKRNSIAENTLLINFIGLRMLLYGIVFLILIMILKFNPFLVPQWILLIAIGILIEWDFIKKSFKR